MMALFGRKKTEEKKEEPKAVAPSAAVPMPSSIGSGLAHVLKNPRITEKATTRQAQSVYTFDVAGRATKTEIRDAVRALYGVSARKVHVVTIHSKKRRNVRTGARGTTRAGRKAYVYLKKGETITIT